MLVAPEVQISECTQMSDCDRCLNECSFTFHVICFCGVLSIVWICGKHAFSYHTPRRPKIICLWGVIEQLALKIVLKVIWHLSWVHLSQLALCQKIHKSSCFWRCVGLKTCQDFWKVVPLRHRPYSRGQMLSFAVSGSPSQKMRMKMMGLG